MKRFNFLPILIISFAIIFLVMFGCDTEDNKSESSSMELLEAPTSLPSNIDMYFTYAVRVTGAAPDCVVCEVTKMGGFPQASFSLFDDGSTRLLPHHLYASERSDDIQANNGTYTRSINGLKLADSSNTSYTFRFVAMGGTNLPDPVTIDVDARNVQPCMITAYPPDHVFEQCFDPLELEMHVSPSENDEIVSASGTLFAYYLDQYVPLQTFEFAHQLGDRWTYTYTPSLFRQVDDTTGGMGFIPYWFEYSAQTRFGMTCTELVLDVQYNNHIPVLSNSTLPDTAYRPEAAGDTNLIMVTVDMDDCELAGATDFYGLRFDATRDPNNWPQQNPADFFLRDDGTAPDVLPGDGTYSSWLVVIKSDSLLDNLYYFRFYAIDEHVATVDTSAFLMDTIRIIQPGAIADGEELNPSDLGIGVWNPSKR